MLVIPFLMLNQQNQRMHAHDPGDITFFRHLFNNHAQGKQIKIFICQGQGYW